MQYLDLTLPILAENLALDEALLLAAEENGGSEVLRVWEWPHLVVVLGSGCKVAENVKIPTDREDAVPVARRSSGGGTVLVGAGCLMYSLVIRYDRAAKLGEIRPSYAYILDRVAQALSSERGAVSVQGVSDLAIGDRKFSGNAQQRKRDHLLHHGTLLYDFDLDQVERYLLPPPCQPAYRASRPHREFLCNLAIPSTELRARLRAIWNASEGPPAIPTETVARLVVEKYGTSAWVERR